MQEKRHHQQGDHSSKKKPKNNVAIHMHVTCHPQAVAFHKHATWREMFKVQTFLSIRAPQEQLVAGGEGEGVTEAVNTLSISPFHTHLPLVT